MAKLSIDPVHDDRPLWRRLLVNTWLFSLLIVLGTGADLLSKEVVFADLGVPHEAILAAVQADETHRANVLAVTGEPLPANPNAYLKPPHGRQPIILIDGREQGEALPTSAHLTLKAVLNPGAFGGLLGGHIEVLIVLSVIAVFAVGWLLFRGEHVRLPQQFVGGLIIAGAFGNIFDRVAFNCVRDFVDFTLPGVHFFEPWNTFNLADSMIVCGIIGLLLLELFRRPVSRHPELEPPESIGNADEGFPAACDRRAAFTFSIDAITYRRSTVLQRRKPTTAPVRWAVVEGTVEAGEIHLSDTVILPLDGGGEHRCQLVAIARLRSNRKLRSLTPTRPGERVRLCLCTPPLPEGRVVIGDATRPLRGAPTTTNERRLMGRESDDPSGDGHGEPTTLETARAADAAQASEPGGSG